MELETLEVKIQAQARQANGQIDALITRLGKLSSSLQSIDSSGINRLSTGVNRLSNSMSAMRSVDSRSFSTLARNIKTLSNIDTGKINAAAGAMRQISKSVSSFSGMSKSVQGLSELAGGIKQLGYTSSTKAIENIPKLAVAMRQLISELSKAPSVSKGAGISGLADDIGSASGGMDDLSNAAGNAGKNTGGIAKNAKKAKKEIQQATRAFDELKVISKQSKDNTSGSGNKGSGSGSGSGAGGGTGADGGLVQTDTIFKKFKSKIKDLEQLGESISGALINAMKKIKWEKVYAKAEGFGRGLAKFLNGLFKGQKGTTLFGETGKLIANSLNTVLHGLDSFGTTFNWKQFGNSIADGINKFFQNFDFALLAKTLNSWAQGAFDTVTTALSKISWKDVWNGAKEFLSNLDVKTVGIIIGALTIKKILGLHLAKTALDIIGTSISKEIAGSLASRLGVEIAANEGISAVLSTALSKKIGGAFATLGTTVSAGVKALFGSGAAESALSFISPVAKAITGIGSVAIGAFTAISNFVTMLKNGFSWLNEALMLVGVTITAVGAVILGVAAAPAAITAGIVAGGIVFLVGLKNM